MPSKTTDLVVLGLKKGQKISTFCAGKWSVSSSLGHKEYPQLYLYKVTIMQQSLFDHIADDGGDENNIGQEALEGIEVQGVSKVLHTFVLQVFFYTDTIIHYASLAQGLVDKF
jgi:hypothetical protein